MYLILKTDALVSRDNADTYNSDSAITRTLFRRRNRARQQMRLHTWDSDITRTLVLLPTSVAVSAEIPLRSPQKIFIFIIKKIIFWVKVSKNKILKI